MPDVEHLLAQARAHAQVQDQLKAVLQQAMSSPHTIVTHELCSTAVRYDEVSPGRTQPVLMIGTLDGQRRDIRLGGPAAVALAKALTPTAVEEPVAMPGPQGENATVRALEGMGIHVTSGVEEQAA